MDNKPEGDFISDARVELSGMIEQGFSHPSTKPVLTYGAIGAVAAAIIPFVGMPLGFMAGAGYKFYKRVRPD